MEPNSLKWVGSPCGLHGPYVFYKAFKFHLEGKPRILSLGDFFFVRCKPGDPICIAELQLLWEERTSKQLLSSSKLYFLPEDTPQGRTVCHGEDEIVAVSEKVIVKLDNLVKWTVSDASRWTCGLRAVPLKPSILKELGNNGRRDALHKYRESTLNSGLNFKDVLKEKAELGDDEEGKKVLVLSYPQYCRYRSVIARLRERPSSLLMDQVVLALGGIASLNANTRILYCRDTFDHPTLIQNESISEEFAPNLKGRPRKKKPSISQRRDSQGPAKDSGCMDTSVPAKVKSDPKAVVAKPRSGSGGWRKVPAEEQGEARPAKGEGEEQAFLVSLYKYMKERGTPIERIPYLGFKQINLWTMFQAAQKLGGYEPITGRRQWKNVYDELGGNPGSTSAATCTRRHYERLLLPYERHMKGEEDKPLPLVKPRRPEPGVQEGDERVKATLGKRPKVPQGHPASGEANTFPKSPRPSPKSDSGEESAEPTVQAVEETKTQDEDEEEEEQLGVEEEPVCANACEEETPPCRISAEDGITKSLSGDPAGPHGGLETQALSLMDEDPAVETFSPEPRLSHVHNRPTSIPDCTIPGCDGTANETDGHVGLVPPTPKPLRAAPGPEAPVDEDDSRLSYKTGPPPVAGPVVMSPLAKKKLLSQVSVSAAPANCYPFSPAPAFALASHNGRIPHGPGVAVSRPSVIQRAQSFKPLGHRKQEVTSELFQQDLAQPGATVGLYPAEKQMGPTSHRVPSSFASFYPAHPLLSLYRQGEHCLGREASFTRNEGNGSRFSPLTHPERTGSGYRLPLTEGNPAYGEVPSDEEPTDLSLPKSFPHAPCPSMAGQCCPALQPPHRDCSPDYLPKSCRVPPMSVPSVPRKPQDPPPLPARTPVKDIVLGRHFMCASRPLRRTLEELEKGPPEKKIRAVTPMHPARACTPDQDAQDKLGDGLAEGHKFPVRGPLFPPLYPGVQEACDRYPHPLQCLKSQAVVSPLLPPFALHSLMVQRQLLASAAVPHLYRPPGGASYRDLLHHGLFPMSALNPPPTYSPPPLPSLHPSTKL